MGENPHLYLSIQVYLLNFKFLEIFTFFNNFLKILIFIAFTKGRPVTEAGKLFHSTGDLKKKLCL